jgi:AcrR family transcriptional regulator
MRITLGKQGHGGGINGMATSAKVYVDMGVVAGGTTERVIEGGRVEGVVDAGFGEVSAELPATAPLRQRQRVRLLAEIRRSALHLFAQRGFEQVTVEDIATAAGVSKSTFFRHAASKEALLIDPLLEGISGIVAEFEAQPADRDTREALIAAAVECTRATPAPQLTMWRRALRTAPGLVNRISLVSESDRERLSQLAGERMKQADPGRGDPLLAGLMVTVIVAAGSYVFQNWIFDDLPDPPSLAERLETALRSVSVR